jgi:WD40 repeat protein
VLRRERAKRKKSWPRRARRWAKGLFRVAMALTVSALAVSYEQRTRVSSANSSNAAQGEAKAAAPSLQLTGHRGAVIAVASTVDQWIVSAGADATMRIWRPGSGDPVRTIALREGPVTAFAVDGHRALVGHQDGTVVLWDLDDATRLAAFRHGSTSITSVAFLGNRLIAASGDAGVALLDTGTSTAPAVLLGAHDHGGYLIAATRVRSLLVSAGFDQTVRLWRGLEPQPQLLRTWRLTGDSAAVAIAPDGSYVAVGSVDGVVRFRRSPALRGPGAHAAQTFRAHAGRVTAIAFGPAGLLASAGEDGSLKLWTLRPERIVRALAGGQVQSLSFSRDGRRLIAGGKDGIVRVWSITLPPSGAT